jgi:O-acetyl-ADP-ribose deacetylase (regulator of RNase III)
MKIVYKTGDLLEAPERTICHGCNAQGKMGAGIAVPIKKRYPMAFDAYRQLYEAQGNRLELGQAIWVSCPDGRTVINAIIQEFYGREPGVVYVSYPAIRSVIDQIDIWARARMQALDEAPVVAFPKIGAGLAMGDWPTIEAIIEDHSSSFQPVVYVLE